MASWFTKIKIKRGSKEKVKNVVLDEAEPILVRAETAAEGETQEPDRIKIGDGETTVENLETVAYISDIDEHIVSKEQVIFKSFIEFPSIGDPNKLYVAKDKNKTYRWDSTALAYYVVGSDYSEIDLIDCGGANA